MHLQFQQHMPYVLESSFKDGEMIVKFEELNEGELRKHVVDRVVKHLEAETTAAPVDEAADEDKPSDILTKQVTKIEPGTIVARSPDQKFFFDGDPTEEAAKRGWVKKFPAKGQWFYGPEITALQHVNPLCIYGFIN